MKNDILKGKVVDYTHDGKGIVKVDNIPFFIKDVIINEEITFVVTKFKKKFGFGKVIEVLEKSDSRVTPKCEFFQQCGGCQLQHMNYEEQVSFKKAKVLNAFSKYATKLDNLDFIENKDPFYYRNKLSIPFGASNAIFVGLYRENSNNIIKIDKCIIQDEMINDSLSVIVEELNKFNPSIYDKFNNNGYLRQLVIKKACSTNQLLLGFVVNDTKYDGYLDQIVSNITDRLSSIKTVVINFNKEPNNVILGKNSYVLKGLGYVEDKIDDIVFNISINSFYQVNYKQMINLYNKAIAFADISRDEVVLDAYCGIGTISLLMAKHAKKVVGVDIVSSAIKDAKNNCNNNGINNVSFVRDDVEKYMTDNKETFNCVIIDPPRKGCSPYFLDSLIVLNPEKIIYISCDVATQARDIKILCENNYQIVEACSVDMFSQTHHIENVVSLRKK